MKTKAIFSVFGACLAIAFAVGACDDSHHHGWRGGESSDNAGSCSAFTACDTCTAANGCGWCFNSDGTGTCGDDANQCSTEWTWESNFCRDAADASVVSTSDDASSSRTVSDDASDDSDANAASDASDD